MSTQCCNSATMLASLMDWLEKLPLHLCYYIQINVTVVSVI